MNFQQAIPTVQITAQPIALSFSTQVNKVHTSKSDKEFVVYMQNPQGGQKQVGKFSSEASANSFVHDYTAYISRLNKINEGIAQTQSHYYNLGLDDIARELKPLEPIYIEISAAGKKSNVYEGDRKFFTGELREGRNEALTEAKKRLSDDITSHEKNFHSLKKRTAEDIFSSPYYSQHVKQLEAERIIREQQQHVGDLNAVKMQGQSLQHEIPKAEKKAKKIHDDTNNFSSRKQIGREFNAFDAIKQLRIDESSNKERTGDIQKRIEDNNFLLQIAQGSTTTEEVNAVQRDLEQKKSAKNTAVRGFEDKSEKFQKTKKDNDHKKVKEATSNVNHTTQELDEAYNRYYALQGLDYKVEPTPAIKPPEKASGWEKTKAWINENVSASGEVNIITAAAPENKGSPIAPSQGSLFQYELGTPASGDSQYWATVHQAAIDRYHSEQVHNEPPKKTSHGSTSALPSSPSQPFNPKAPITIPNPFCPGLDKEISPMAPKPIDPILKTPMYISPSFVPPPMPHQFINQFIPTEVGGLTPVQTPALPQPSRPIQTETALVSSTQTKSFGKKVLEAAVAHFSNKGFIPNGSPIQLGPRTQLMFLPTEATAQINRLAGFDSRIQLKYPEAYALASEIDKFGREKVTLLRVSIEEHERSRNRLELARTVKKVSVQVVKVWNNPRFQGSIQAAGGLAEAGLGAVVSIGTGGLAAPGGLALFAHGLDHYIAGMQTAFSGVKRDTVTVQALQGLGLSHNVSELVDAGISIGGGLGAGRALAVAPKMTMTRGLLVQEQMVKRVAEQRAFIERMNSPAYRSGVGNPWSEMVVSQPRTLNERTVTAMQPRSIQATRGINRSNNHQFIPWAENGRFKMASIGEMSYAGTFHDRGGLTKAGRAFEKHGQRVDTVFPRPSGNIHQKNMEGQRILDEILNHPEKRIAFEYSPTIQNETIAIRLPDGRGVRFTKDGKEMIGFLDP